jgi:hypothetical protein
MSRGRRRQASIVEPLVLGGLSLLLGTTTIVVGLLFPRYPQFQPYVIGSGLVLFYLPGLALVGAAWGVWKRQAWPVRLGIVAAGWQVLAATTVGVWFAFWANPFSIVPVLEAVLWTLAASLVAWRLWRSLPWLATDVNGRRGFAVEASPALVGR